MSFHQGTIRDRMTDRIGQLQKMLENEPGDTFCLYGLAMEYAKLGKHEQAVEWFDRTLAGDPNYCYAYFHKAKSQEQLGDMAAASQTLRHGLGQSRKTGDNKAANEIEAYLDELNG
jgi:tetratricopeptide (TPR) repeat protein